MIMSVFRPSRKAEGKRVRSRFFYGQYRLSPAAPIVRVPLHTHDKRIAEERLRNIVVDEQRAAEGLIPPQPIRDAAQQQLTYHLDAYVADIRARGASAMYYYNIEHRVLRLLQECAWVFPRDVTSDSFVTWRARQSKAAKTLNDYCDAMTGLLSWMVRQGRLAMNPLVAVEKVETRGREVRRRRAMSDGELQRLLAVAAPSRRALYLMAAYTGLRRGELAQVTWDDIQLDGDTPSVRARASTTKNKLEAVQPLHGDVVDALKSIRPAVVTEAALVFDTVPRPEQFRKDLAVAGIPYKDAFGRQADFHSLRYTFGTNLARAGVQPRVAMELMRHSDMALTTKIYTDASKLPTFGAVAALPSLAQTAPEIYAQPDAQELRPAGPGQSQGVRDSNTAYGSKPLDNKGDRHDKSRQVA